MSIQTKKIFVNNKTYSITQHPATEGCLLIEKYYTALLAFANNQETRSRYNRAIYPFVLRLDGAMLGLLMFIDRAAAPADPYTPYERLNQLPLTTLSVRDIKAGRVTPDCVESVDELETTPFEYSIQYTATTSQEESIDLNDVFGQFFRYITFDGETIDLNMLNYKELAGLMKEWMSFNMLHLWSRPRWALPTNYSGNGIHASRTLQGVRESYSQSNVIYTILNSSQNLATYAELSTVLSISDAYDMNETALLKYYEDTEMQKEMARQSKQN